MLANHYDERQGLFLELVADMRFTTLFDQIQVDRVLWNSLVMQVYTHSLQSFWQLSGLEL